MVNTERQNMVYKIFTETEWQAFQNSGQFKGSADDLRDGFIHLSTSEQVDGVIERFFLDKQPLYIAGFSAPEFLQAIKWEASSTGEVYPHLYHSALFVSEVISFVRL